MTSYRVITDAEALARAVDALREEPLYAVDTEFHRERTYFPKLALVQLRWGDDLVLVDPLAVDPSPLAAVFEGPGTAVAHAADQDLEVLDLACGAIPARLFDTQIAAGFLGMTAPSLSRLHSEELGVRLPKGDRLTDWLRRPLGDSQLRYAAADVAYLLDLHARLRTKLERAGRLQWALDECEEVRARGRGPVAPEDAWSRVKELRRLRGPALAVAQAVAAWRERRAREVDQPPRFVLSDLAVLGVSQRRPESLEELRNIRGVDDRHLRRGLDDALLGVIREGGRRPPPGLEPRAGERLSRDLRPVISLVSAWIGQLARDLDLETALLATRADVEALLRDDEDARLSHGWRAEVAGEAIRRLAAGEAALAFDGNGRLALEARSRQAIDPG